MFRGQTPPEGALVLVQIEQGHFWGLRELEEKIAAAENRSTTGDPVA
jgi:hypothetical protein